MFPLVVFLLLQTILRETRGIAFEPINQEVGSGETATISCKITGGGELKTTVWYKSNGDELTSSATGYTVTQGTYDSGSDLQTTTLTVEGAQTTADATYNCSVNGEPTQGTVTLNVYVVTAADKTVATATSATLTCSITDVTQAVTVTWKNGAADDLSGSSGDLAQYTVAQGSVFSNQQDSTLTITTIGLTALTNAATNFTCLVKSGEYTTSPEVSKTLTMTKLTYGIAVTNKEVEKGTEATLTCTVSGLPTQATVAWKASAGTDLTNDNDYAIGGAGFDVSANSQQSTLTVKAAANTADKILYCTVTSAEWSKTAEENAVALNVFEVTAADKTVATNTSATLTCSITDITQAVTVTWKNAAGDDLNTLSEYTVVQGSVNNNKQNSTLTITQTGLSALGATASFTCLVKSGQYPTSPEVSKTLTMTKESEDTDGIAFEAVNQEVGKGETATISCKITGGGELKTAAWYKANGDELTSGTTGYTVTQGTYSTDLQTTTLTVEGAQTTADATYNCGVNGEGTQGTVTLNVYEVAAANTTVATNTSATLTCSIADVTRAVTVTWKNGAAQDLSGSGGSLDEYTVVQGSVSSNQQNSTLTITPTGLSALGATASFTCLVKSGQYPTSPEVSKTLTMTKLTYLVTVTNKEVEKGTEATLTCTVSGLSTQATVAWKATTGGSALSDDTDYTIGGTGFSSSTNSQQSTLTVKAAANIADKIFYCTVTAEETAVALNVFEVGVNEVGSATSTDGAILLCTVTGLTQLASVQWRNAKGEDLSNSTGILGEYTVETGKLEAGKQESTLTITTTALKGLEAAARPFTCAVKSGLFPEDSPEVLKTLDIAIVDYDSEVTIGNIVAAVLGGGVVVAIIIASAVYCKKKVGSANRVQHLPQPTQP